MNSCLYECLIMHDRLEPRKSKFHYGNLMFYLNLDEIDTIARKRWFFSRNRFNIFNFKDADHLVASSEGDSKPTSIKEHIVSCFKENGVEVADNQIMVLSNVSTFGYLFNPVSFYFLLDEYNDPLCSIVEVNHKSSEKKYYFIGKEKLRGQRFYLDTPKFYGSPFIENDENVHFNLEVPGKIFSIKIDDQNKDGKRVFVSTMLGKKRKLNAVNLFWYSLVFPFEAIRMTSLLRWHSFKLMFRVIIHYKSIENPELQREVYKPYRP
ncbi:DUF1365 domain-containing protein [Solitalea sp. MAHUQ-68]|uniref:DUF1365 domain-containing protein n=1 Tax=Solitalea agri TaxID=2953739 RepID=A0A9X2JEW3_9SPHI|nr:DUF1365 family protein [Solitalea agri]MCO4294355.1 DUF1365 domain-containing protein [Solitalea agri]